ncbi:arabinogalactan endo-beta-1,4-galactanase [uncultured Fibrella sp.]|uniref:glycoside hydrolase family 53 protein n=1 Tax=uncultured Fibrella sp. TaxID=1284596 RepID=UPI0035CA5989
MKINGLSIALAILSLVTFNRCKQQDTVAATPGGPTSTTVVSTTQAAGFQFGADLSYVNQILDHGGLYMDQNEVRSPYRILKDQGATVARFRLWHTPTWTKTVYGTAGTQLYNDLADVEKSIRLAREQGLLVNLDIHYSDVWADPARQDVPTSWTAIKTIDVLADSVYQYTLGTLLRLNSKGLMPDMVQIGNEINCGMLYGNVPASFPACNACKNQWSQLGQVINSGIRAVRTASASSVTKPKVLLHVADPKNVEWWFDNIKTQGNVTDFDVVGFSYYPLWHTTIPVDRLSGSVAQFKSKYGKQVMMLETAYPWSTGYNDTYANQFGSQTPIAGYPFTQQGQLDLLKLLTQQMKDGGGSGIMYWEPAWITSSMKDLYGTGSSWENATLFDFSGKPTTGMAYMKQAYK